MCGGVDPARRGGADPACGGVDSACRGGALTQGRGARRGRGDGNMKKKENPPSLRHALGAREGVDLAA